MSFPLPTQAVPSSPYQHPYSLPFPGYPVYPMVPPYAQFPNVSFVPQQPFMPVYQSAPAAQYYQRQ